jgi:hypothetical protein
VLLRSPFGFGAAGPDAARSCPELLPRLQELLEVAPSQVQLHGVSQQKGVSPAGQAALDTLEFIKRSGFTQIPDYKVDKRLYQRFFRYLHAPEFQTVLKENPQAWALVEPVMNRKNGGTVRRAALDTLEFIKDSKFTELPNAKADVALYARFLKYRDNPEFQAVLKENPQTWSRVEALLHGKDLSAARQAGLDTVEFIRRSRFTELPSRKADNSVYERYLKYRNDPEFQAALRENPEAWARIEQLLKRREDSSARRAALDTLDYIQRTGFTQLPDYKMNELYQRYVRYRDDLDFQSVLKENPRAWALIEPVLKRKNAGGIRQAALDTLEYIKSTGFTKLPGKTVNNALYQRFAKYRDDPEFQATLREDPEIWSHIEPLMIRVSAGSVKGQKSR